MPKVIALRLKSANVCIMLKIDKSSLLMQYGGHEEA
jgi:hypothetical protein